MPDNTTIAAISQAIKDLTPDEQHAVLAHLDRLSDPQVILAEATAKARQVKLDSQIEATSAELDAVMKQPRTVRGNKIAELNKKLGELMREREAL